MKRAIIILAIVFLIGYFAWKITRKATGATRMEFDIDGVNIDVSSFSDLLGFALSGKDSTINIIVSNYSNETYAIDTLYVELYSLPDENGQSILIGYQTQPVKDIEIQPMQNTTIALPVFLKGALIYQLAKQLSLSDLSQFYNVLQNYFATGKFGTAIVVKGYAVLKGIKLPFEFQKAI